MSWVGSHSSSGAEGTRTQVSCLGPFLYASHQLVHPMHRGVHRRLPSEISDLEIMHKKGRNMLTRILFVCFFCFLYAMSPWLNHFLSSEIEPSFLVISLRKIQYRQWHATFQVWGKIHILPSDWFKTNSCLMSYMSGIPRDHTLFDSRNKFK